MEEIIQFLQSHVSCRNYTGQEISVEDEITIIETAQRCATSSNLQAYSIIGVRDKKKKDTIKKLVGDQQHVSDASLFLIFCADLYRLKLLNETRGYPFIGEYTESCLVATVDASLAGCRALMAAQALGIGGVMVGSIRNHPDSIVELLHLPELVYPVFGLSLGYPQTMPKIKPRLPLEAIYHRETYDATQYPEHFKEYDDVIASLDYMKGREVQPENYPDFAGIYSWSEHTARRMALKSAAREHMLSFLQNQGFMKK